MLRFGHSFEQMNQYESCAVFNSTTYIFKKKKNIATFIPLCVY